MVHNIHNDQFILNKLLENLESCILGKSEELRLLVTAMIAKGHVLLEDVPGTGKTVLIKALAKSVSGQFRRIQCNPDLLPTDITGVSIYHPKEEAFVFRPGPVMTHILLADEINRATTKTQAALLEAMEERVITVDGESYELPKPFLLFATQNPIDFEGTYTLPEAQLDRFSLKISLGYPDFDTELLMVASMERQHPLEKLQPVATIEDVLRMQNNAKQIHIDRDVVEYAIRIIRGTRESSEIYLGASPRATLSLIDMAKAFAYVCGREYVIPDDIKLLAPYVLQHRMILQPEFRMSGRTERAILRHIIEQVPAPVRMGR